MLPMSPSSHSPTSPPHEPPRASYSVTRTVLMYAGCGAIAGAVTGVVTALVGLGFAVGYQALGRHHVLPRTSMKVEEAVFFVLGHLLGGAILGVFCGHLLWMLTAFWTALRHPLRAASLCASLGGSLRLLIAAFVETLPPGHFLRIEPGYGERTFIEIGAVLVAGATFGYVTARLVAIVEPRFVRTIRD